jgi:predicted DNA-binding transcriptional regulator YafY
MRKKSRLFALAEALRARRTGVTAQELATRFGVTLRTIYRDLEALQDAGMPIRADRGRGGGYALDKTYQLPPVNFTAREAALLIAGELQLVGVPALPVPATIQSAVETAWFESRALRIVYSKASGHASPRLVRIRNLVFDRAVTLLNCIDLETGNDRQFRLDRVLQAQVMDSNPS